VAKVEAELRESSRLRCHAETAERKQLKFCRLTMLTACALGQTGLLVATAATAWEYRINHSPKVGTEGRVAALTLA
jgi:hypothetical protein